MKTVLAVAAGVVVGGLCLCGGALWMVSPHGRSAQATKRKWADADTDRLFDEVAADSEKKDALSRYTLTDGPGVVVTPKPGSFMVLFRLRDASTAILHSLEGYGDLNLEADSPKEEPRIGMTDFPKGWDRPTTLRLVGARSADIILLSGKPETP